MWWMWWRWWRWWRRRRRRRKRRRWRRMDGCCPLAPKFGGTPAPLASPPRDVPRRLAAGTPGGRRRRPGWGAPRGCAGGGGGGGSLGPPHRRRAGGVDGRAVRLEAGPILPGNLTDCLLVEDSRLALRHCDCPDKNKTLSMQSKKKTNFDECNALGIVTFLDRPMMNTRPSGRRGRPGRRTKANK